MTHLQQIDALWQYLLMKVHQSDLHGIRDACVDLEVLEAKVPPQSHDLPERHIKT